MRKVTRRMQMIRKQLLTIALIVTFFCLPNFASARHCSLTTTLDSYIIGEEVVFTLSNPSGPPIRLSNDAPYEIRKKGRLIFTPKRPRRTRTVEPGSPAMWRWDQRDMGGKPVTEGTYTIVLYTVGDGQYSASFKIVSNGRGPFKERSRVVSRAAYEVSRLFSSAAVVALVAPPPAGEYLLLAEVVTCGIGFASDLLAVDPPDSNYREPVVLGNTRLTMPPASSRLDAAAGNFISAGLKVYDLYNALRLSIERMDGAQEAKESDFANQHRNAVRGFAEKLPSAVKNLQNDAMTFANELKMAGIVEVSQESVKRFAAQGFPPQEISAFRQIGFTENDITKAQSILQEQGKGGSILDRLGQFSNYLMLLNPPLTVLIVKGE